MIDLSWDAQLGDKMEIRECLPAMSREKSKRATWATFFEKN